MTSRHPPRGRDAYRHWTRIAIRAEQNNRAGHVDNTVYYGWFDAALIAWLTEQGLLGPAPMPTVFIAESRCRFVAELSYPGDVDIGFAVDRIGGSSVAYRLGIFAADAETPAAEGDLTQVCIDPAARRPTPLPETWRTRLATVRADD